MKTLRPLFYLLLAGNIILAILSVLSLAGFQFFWTPSGEADRLSRQLTPEKILVIQPAARPVSTTPTTPTASEGAAPASPGTLVCVALRNLSLESTQKLSEMAASAGEGVVVRLNGVTPTSYWVNIPPSGGKEGASKRAEILTKAGLEDFLIVREAGPNQFAISLGLYRSEEAAKRRLGEAEKKKISTARITMRDNTGNNARAELSGRSEQLEPLLQGFTAAYKDAVRDACQLAN